MESKNKNSLLEATKTEMQYTEKVKSCKNCRHSKEEEDKHLDRSWYRICYFSNLCPFVVKDSASCNHFESL